MGFGSAIAYGSAATTTYPDGQPFKEGESLRVCSTNAPDTPTAVLTYPDATTANLAADSENCWTWTLTQSGDYTLTWLEAATPVTYKVNASPNTATDFDWWLNFTFLALMLWYGFTRRAILVGAFAITGIFAFVFNVVPFDFQEVLIFLLFAFALEWAANKWKIQK